MEYKEFAKYYDIFYQKKDYIKEVEFLKNFISANNHILDIGCGTGLHGKYLKEYGCRVDGLDLNKEMLDLAKTRLNGELYNQDMLDLKIAKKYDVIISMFAVINHLRNLDELKLALKNMSNILNPNGKIIIDLHNPQSSGEKTDKYEDMTRTMKWNLDRENKIETSKITFTIDEKSFEDEHIFKIFSIGEVKDACIKVGLKVVNVYENYNIKVKGNSTSKNLQFVIEKNTD